MNTEQFVVYKPKIIILLFYYRINIKKKNILSISWLFDMSTTLNDLPSMLPSVFFSIILQSVIQNLIFGISEQVKDHIF